METKIKTTKDAILIPFNEYTVHYYSQSNAEWEAALIHCFSTEKGKSIQVGTMFFTYPNGTTPPGLENPIQTRYPTSIPPTQKNGITNTNLFNIYYTLNRFNDVVNQLRYGVDQNKSDAKGDADSMFVSADPYGHVWALCNNYHVQVGAQYNL